jgi:alpha/beta superfamily hydrolase
MLSFPQKQFVLRTPHAQLSAVLHPARGKALVILCHGFTGNKSECVRLFVQAAQAFQKAGLNVLRFDFMGSGDSSGGFNEMSPNTQIQDALDVLAWSRRRYRKIALLGLSLGGGTVICAAHQARPRPDALLTWSSLPSFRWWRPAPPPGEKVGTPMTPGKRFYRDRPKVDIPEAYVALDIPRLQIQGDHDLPELRERFEAFCPKNDPLVRHLVIPGADHVFTNWDHRRRVIAESTRWLKKHLGGKVAHA